ncbi:MAG: glycosyltransferase family 2 protein, partial [Atopobiaceae bacterium]|nr:glycosyltransferase family 2 protein [Atopobiaceae bacterium]
AMLDPDYNDWFIHNHRSNPRSISLQRTVSFDIQPTFSIVVPLYHTPLTFLDEMIQSVLSQTYSRFELILVNSTTEDLDLTLAVDKYAKSDKRIKVISLNTNLGITENTNAGIRSATGDFIAFLDHDDILEPDILYQYVVGINEYPTTDLLYCDEDKVQDGVYSAPNLKPDFDWDRLYSFNYVCHMLTVRSSVLNTLELPGSEFDGAQDYHMTLRVAEKARNIFHARKVLYHWRIHDGSVASNADAKSWTSDAGTLAIQTHFDRIGVHAHVTARDISPNTYKVNYELFDKPLISIVIPNKDASAYLKRCLDSILHGTSYDNLEIIVVENNSSEPETFEYYDQVVKDDPRVKVLRYQGEFNYSAINNWAVDQSTGEYVILLNNDIKVISPDWIEQMLGHFLEKRVGIVGAKLLFPDNTVQHAGVRMRPAGPNHIFLRYPSDMPGYLSYNLVCRQCSAVTGACLMVSREAFDDVGGLDVGFRVAFNDVDFCLRVGATGRSVVWEPDALLYHYESVSRGLDDLDNTKLLRLKKESGTLQSRWPEGFTGEDPFSSVSFDYETLYCALRK